MKCDNIVCVFYEIKLLIGSCPFFNDNMWENFPN